MAPATTLDRADALLRQAKARENAGLRNENDYGPGCAAAVITARAKLATGVALLWWEKLLVDDEAAQTPEQILAGTGAS